MNDNLIVLGGGESGVGAAYLASQNGISVFLSDKNLIELKYKEILIDNGIEFEEGSHSIDKVLKASEIVKSPGIPNDSVLINDIIKKNIPIISEIEFASRFTNAKIIGVTGSNGKTTTVSLIYHILKTSGLNVGIGGNIGNSLAFLIAKNKFDYIVLELSSFQLEGINKFKPSIAVITNLSPDHLERYDYSFEKYVDAKFNIVNNQTSSDYLIYNSQDTTIDNELKSRKISSSKIPFSLVKGRLSNQTYIEKNSLKSEINKNQFMISLENLSLKGKHNLQNSMAAATVAHLLKITNQDIKESLSNFHSINHRMENVLTIQKVKYINDSKATNVNAVYYALDSMKNSTVWIVGGVDKGNDYNELLPLVREKVKAIICLGLDNKKIIETFSSISDLILETTSMSEAVNFAYKIAKPNDAVLLSPACSSFDLFEDYEDRGNQFKECVRKL
ncbi:MAG: UDP-N-acetylmuramoyl-L-alanine--D-glutamate ligase [Flavobacteriaceae bacterium]|nr:UDP-N-acetylmuramoyl-L-alanine--D-glutamate ligase [Flavobacteriaceae bacterium]RCL66512.1 MAG: UDP-N-acetylmuramoyl-L-alanine--D-glutamate ligase [Cryomorphaceae bacterium]|tara:strand:+ start:1274 stop:2614 length:1341 start_codon:yes stop_codon:yes gene_type:complete